MSKIISNHISNAFAYTAVILLIGIITSCSQSAFIPYPQKISTGEVMADKDGLLAISPELYRNYPPKTKLLAQRVRFEHNSHVSRDELFRVINAIDFLINEFFLPSKLPQKILIKISEKIGHRPQTKVSVNNINLIEISSAALTRNRENILVHELFHAIYLNERSSVLYDRHELWATYAELIFINRNVDSNLNIAKIVASQYGISLDNYFQPTFPNLWETNVLTLKTEEEYYWYAMPIFLFDKVSNLNRILDYVEGVSQPIPLVIDDCITYYTNLRNTSEQLLNKQKERLCSIFFVEEYTPAPEL